VPAYAGIPVTHRGTARSFAVITGTETSDSASTDWAALAAVDTLVVLMGAATLPEVTRKLVAAGRSAETPAASIANGTLASQRTVMATLGTIAQAVAAAGLPTPLLTVVGDVVALSDRLAWRESLPLAGRSVVVTRTRAQASRLRTLLESLGAAVIEAPVLEIRHKGEDLTTDERVSSRWDWIVFSSQNGVEAFFEAIRHAGRDTRALGTTRVATIGLATATMLGRHGVLPDFVPSTATSECLSAELPRVSGARILIPAGSLSDLRLADALRARGAHIEQVRVYETVAAALDDSLVSGLLRADAITFASASAASFLAAALGERALPGSVSLCAIGPQAAAATRAAFGRVDAIAEEPSLESLVQSVVGALS
jgi:uroporphyrinogen III methyltransferase/synthase